MQITVTIPDELALRAQVRGLALDRYLPQLLAEVLAAETQDEGMLPTKMSGDAAQGELARRHAAVEAMLGFAEKHGFTTGGRDLKSMVHEGHPY